MQPGKEGTLVGEEYLGLHFDRTLAMSHYVGRRRNALGASTAIGLKDIATIPKATKQTTKQTLFA